MKYFEKGTKIGQVISKDDIAKWKEDGRDVIFSSGTSTGKTTFILTNLADYCKEHNERVLFICSRKVLAEEVKSLIKEREVNKIDVTTYQAIENKLKNNQDVNLDYDWIAADEAHYFLEIFNRYTDTSFKHITKHPAQKIYMSATCDGLFDSFVQNGIVPSEHYYSIDRDYSYLSKISFYNNKDDIDLIINEKLKNKDEKILFFSQSMSRLKETYLKHRDYASFFCSSYSKDIQARKFLKECDGDISNMTFNKKLLVSSKAMDVGINIIDSRLSTIILDVFSWQTLIQCMGRKRLDETLGLLDTCEIYIRNYHRGELNIQHNQHFKVLDMFINNREEYNNSYGLDREYYNPYIFKDPVTGELSANIIAYYSMCQDENDLDIMKNQYWVDENFEQHRGLGYRNFILDKLKIERSDNRVEDYDREKEDVRMYSLNEYLESVVGNVMLMAKDREELIEKINVRDGKNNRLVKGIKTLNSYLSENHYDYVIREFKTSRIVDGKKKNYKQAWKVMKLID